MDDGLWTPGMTGPRSTNLAYRMAGYGPRGFNHTPLRPPAFIYAPLADRRAPEAS